MVAAAGAGSEPIPHQSLTSENLAKAIRFCLKAEVLAAAKGIAEKMRSESGVVKAVQSFHAQLPTEDLRCDILPDQQAVWKYHGRRRGLKLSRLAAEILKGSSRITHDAISL